MAYENETKRPVLDLFASFEAGTAKFSDFVVLIACGLNNGARRAGKDTIYAVEDVADLLDDTPEPMQVVVECMQILHISFSPAPGQKKTSRMQPMKIQRPTKARKAG